MTQIGAFEAKTHFSELLRRVARGESFEITRRNEPVAKLVGVDRDTGHEDPQQLLRRVRKLRQSVSADHEEIRDWISEGRR